MNDHDTKPPETGHEASDANMPLVALSGLALAVAVGLVGWGLVGLQDRFETKAERREPAVSPLAAPEQPPPPLLQASPRLELRELQSRQQQLLDSYGWIDRERKIVRIPIDQAMKLVVEEGLPTKVKTVSEAKP